MIDITSSELLASVGDPVLFLGFIAFLLLLGAILLYRVDIDAGIRDAEAEDARIRKMLDGTENSAEE